MNAEDKDFFLKVAKKADDAMALAMATAKALEVVAGPPGARARDADTFMVQPTLGGQAPTEMRVVFGNKLNIDRDTRAMTQLNAQIDQLCRDLGVMELTVSYRRSDLGASRIL